MRHNGKDSPTITQTAVAVMAYLLAVACVTAAITALAFGSQAKRLLAVHFTRLPHHAGAAAGIWFHNARIVMGFAVFLGCAYVIQREERPARIERAILRVCDGALLLWATGTAVLGGVLAGTYGTTQIRAFLPQGPGELTAWTLLIVLFIQVRSQRVGAAGALRQLAVVLLILAVSAVLELWLGA